jgi:hypothetical protein
MTSTTSFTVRVIVRVMRFTAGVGLGRAVATGFFAARVRWTGGAGVGADWVVVATAATGMSAATGAAARAAVRELWCRFAAARRAARLRVAGVGADWVVDAG